MIYPSLTPPYRVAQSWRQWQSIGGSPWLVRQLRFGIQLPWVRQIPSRQTREYPLPPAERQFAQVEISRWLARGFVRLVTRAEARAARRSGHILSTFMTTSAGKFRLVIDYRQANDCMARRPFRMDQLSDLAAVPRPEDNLFKADVRDAYYDLRLRPADRL